MKLDINTIVTYTCKSIITLGVISILIFAAIGIRCTTLHMGNKSPVEENKCIDSLITANDSIKLKVESLDSIKNAKIIEVATLDNDSTVKLFYELVSE